MRRMIHMLVKINESRNNNSLANMVFIEQSNDSIYTIPVVENSRLNGNVVYLRDIDRFTESASIDEIISGIKECNHLDHINIALSESEFIENYFDNKLDSVWQDVIIYKDPISEDVAKYFNDIDLLLEERVAGNGMQHGAFVDNPDELVNLADSLNKMTLDAIQGMFKAKTEDEFNAYKGALQANNTKQKMDVINQKHLAHGVNPIAYMIQGPNLHMQEKIIEDHARRLDAEKFPKSAIAKVIQKLRSLYQGIMHRCDNTSYWDTKLDPRVPAPLKTRILAGIKALFRQVAHFIMNIIDILLRKLQNASDSIAAAGSRFIDNLKNRVKSATPSAQPAMA